MVDFELLGKLYAAYRDDNEDEFVHLCMEYTYDGERENDCALSLYVLYSTIGAYEDTYIGYLNQYATDEEKAAIAALFEKIERFEDYDDFDYEEFDEEVPETEKVEYEEYVKNRKYYAMNCLEELYWKYENELDYALIWDNAEKIIDELSEKLTAMKQLNTKIGELEKHLAQLNLDSNSVVDIASENNVIEKLTLALQSLSETQQKLKKAEEQELED